MAAFLPLGRGVLYRSVRGLMQLWWSEGTHMFLAAVHWGRCACAIWAVPPVPFGALLSIKHLGKREFHRALSFVSSSAFSVSHFPVAFSTTRSLHCQGAGCLLHEHIEPHVAVGGGCRCLPSRLQHRPMPLPTSSAVHQQQFLLLVRGLLPGLMPRSAF